MSINQMISSELFQAFAVILVAVSAIVFLFARQIRSRLAKVRRPISQSRDKQTFKKNNQL